MQDAFAYCEALVRAADQDRFLTALFAPAERRAALFALYAFNIEIARVREVVRDPLAGEIRLQWWSDALGGEARGDAEANPVAAALIATIARYGLPVERLKSLIAARRFDLYNEPMATLAELEAYADGASAGLMALAAGVLAADPSADIARLVHHAGAAHAIAGLLHALPVHAARGQLYIPIEVLRRHGGRAGGDCRRHGNAGAARGAGRFAEDRARSSGGGAGLIGGRAACVAPRAAAARARARLLDGMERSGYDPFAPPEIAPWRRQWLIWRASRKPARLFG